MKKLLFLFAILSMIAVNPSFSKIRTTYKNALIFAYSQVNSVYEDDNIKLEIYNENLWATNKTSKTIFIDLAQCFTIHNGASKPFINTGEIDKKAKENDKKASKAGLSTKEDKYIAIAPSFGSEQEATFIFNMSTLLFGEYGTKESSSESFTVYYKRLLKMIEDVTTESKNADNKNKMYKGSVARHYTEDESMNNIGASIGYSFSKNAEEWISVSFSTWVSDVIFAPYYIEMPDKNKKKKGFGVKESSSIIIHVKADSPFEFDNDKSPLIVCNWTGKYKKGIFELQPVWDSSDKCIINFDGKDSDWGTLVYAEGDIKTGQTGVKKGKD